MQNLTSEDLMADAYGAGLTLKWHPVSVVFDGIVHELAQVSTIKCEG